MHIISFHLLSASSRVPESDSLQLMRSEIGVFISSYNKSGNIQRKNSAQPTIIITANFGNINSNIIALIM